MDEILAANFMLFHDVVREDRYELWIGDEAWELDYYLHENPREKRVPFAWLTDFVGFLPTDDLALVRAPHERIHATVGAIQITGQQLHADEPGCRLNVRSCHPG